MNASAVMDEFMVNLKQLRALDERVGFTREEMTIHLQALFLRASVRLFRGEDKAGFAQTAKIAWDAAHGRPKL